ncbi:esterase/lipase family protein [Risungbinella massiliensis]|uniref:esterase/lipase family protein n=1 Tax=Risungbinella massiliensis TaxID=1329796 RepID=UPI0005CB9E5D|nr:hypothetical protein [Risungbinella massiliensis]
MAFFSFTPLMVEAGKLTPPGETFTPGEWFLGATPPNYDPNKPPIVFVQGKNGTASSWYGETSYHGPNDMYDSAYNAGYQTVFVQLYDAAGNGSYSQWDNGRLLATMLEQIYQRFGKKVNIVAHSKGGPDTQAALVHYGAHRYVGNVITLGSPHHGSHLADLSYSWWAGWLASLLGQRDDGTYSLQVGEMANFRSVTDSHPNAKLNKYYTVAGTDWGPMFSALYTGGMYLSSYGSNDGLVNVWSTKLPYGVHLFTDSNLDHDNIRVGSKVFSRIEPKLRTATINSTNQNLATYQSEQPIMSSSNQTVLGGPLVKNKWDKQTFVVDTKTDGDISVLTATSDTQVKLISPSGKVYTNKNSNVVTGTDQFYFIGAHVQTFQLKQMEVGTWSIQLKSKAKKDAYFMVTQLKQAESISLELPGKVKQTKAKFRLMQPTKQPSNSEAVSFTIRVVDKEGSLVAETHSTKKLDAASFEENLPEVKQSGVYNVTIDVKGKNKEGKEMNRTIVRSVYIEK